MDRYIVLTQIKDRRTAPVSCPFTWFGFGGEPSKLLVGTPPDPSSGAMWLLGSRRFPELAKPPLIVFSPISMASGSPMVLLVGYETHPEWTLRR